MKLSIIIFLLFTYFPALSQIYRITGKITDEKSAPIEFAKILVTQQGVLKDTETNKTGSFNITALHQGICFITIMAHGYKNYTDSFVIDRYQTNLGSIKLLPLSYILGEVTIVQKTWTVAQKDDTLEFNSAAFKVNPDADAADLVKKMPSIEINDQHISAQGETVTKVVVDGRPFFGNDPYSSLKNLPADIIDKVQVYNEKTDQEKFSGFSEDGTTKTINIIIKADKRNGFFGNASAGAGADNNSNGKYGANATINKFNEKQRITIIAQSNNTNIQDFTEQKSFAGPGNGGIIHTNAAGINYSDQWGKKIDITGSYQLSNINTATIVDVRKTYVLNIDSGQVYNESNIINNKGNSHRFNINMDYAIDSLNSLLIQPALSVNTNNSSSTHEGYTEEGNALVNQTDNNNSLGRLAISFSSTFLYRHKFHKNGRTFSVNINANNNSNKADILHTAQTQYSSNPVLNDTINQYVNQSTNIWNMTGNATFTEPSGKNSLFKMEYDVSYIPENSMRNTYDYSLMTNTYTLPDTILSNKFMTNTTEHNAGGSYLFHLKKYELSLGINYQLTELNSEQQFPTAFSLSHQFENLLPVATFHYKFSKTKYLQLSYNTHIQIPSVYQLQNVINNTDPLHLYNGNPFLKQPYQHSIAIRYNNTHKNSFSATINGSLTQHYITTNSIIAQSDTSISQYILLPKGSQLTTPININGSTMLNANISYGMPLNVIKCNLNLSINAGFNHIPTIINNVINFQNNKNGNANISLNSNISEKIDFTISSGTSIISSINSINRLLNTTFVSEAGKMYMNLIVLNAFVLNTGLSYQYYSGLSSGFNNNNLLWNISFGKNFLKSHLADIRLSVFDVLNQNNNIQHIITDTYIQDSRTNVLQRYFLLVFSYKIRAFK